ncbi:MAG: protein kinase [Victivallales bacterium]|nr:protein kinase [Victivallales bacterium]
MNYRVRGIDAFDENMMLRARLEFFLHVCDTISYAHQRNVIHRDLKPENIMIGKYMEVFVMDWGIARVLPKEQASTQPSNEQITGSPEYFAPEVLQRERLDLRSDIFLLGLVLQEVVTLQHAIDGKDEKECMNNIVNGVFASIEHLYHCKIDSSLQAIIQKATAYSLDERYQTVDDLAENLRRYMAHLPIFIKSDNLWNRILRYFFGNHL